MAQAANLLISNRDGYMVPDAVNQFNQVTGNSAELVVDMRLGFRHFLATANSFSTSTTTYLHMAILIG